MITSLALCLLVAQAEPPTAGQLISQMLKRYDASTATTGTIDFTQSWQGQSMTVRTVFGFTGSTKLYIDQSATYPASGVDRNPTLAARVKRATLVSDGDVFSYPRPRELDKGNPGRLFEKVTQNGSTMTARDMYAVGTLSLIDRSPILDIAFARREDLKFFVNQLATVGYVGDPNSSPKTLGGQWRAYGEAAVSGSWEMKLSDAGDLLSYQVVETLQIEGDAKQIASGKVTSLWKADIRVNSEPEPSLFKIVR
jgi:hypothetical protein